MLFFIPTENQGVKLPYHIDSIVTKNIPQSAPNHPAHYTNFERHHSPGRQEIRRYNSPSMLEAIHLQNTQLHNKIIHEHPLNTNHAVRSNVGMQSSTHKTSEVLRGRSKSPSAFEYVKYISTVRIYDLLCSEYTATLALSTSTQ